MSLDLIKPIGAALLGAILLPSCGDGEKRQAEALLIMAESAAENGEYARSIELIDSIDSAYPRQIGTRRKGMAVRSSAGLSQAREQLTEVQVRILDLESKGDSLQSKLTKVDHPLEPYFVARGAKAAAGRNALEARMEPDGMFHMISSLKQPLVHHASVKVTAQNGSEASTSIVTHDGERNDRSMGYEMVHYMMPECDSVGAFIAAHVDEPLSVTYVGEHGRTYTMKMDQTEAEQIAALYDAAVNVRDRRRLAIEEKRLSELISLMAKNAAAAPDAGQ